MAPTIAVLTGDLIASTAALPRQVDQTMRLLSRAAVEIGGDTAFTRFRGDGWQLILTEPGRCLWACLYLLATLRAGGGLATRIAVGIGEEYPTDRTDLSTAIGPAFTASGRGLEDMRRDETLTIHGSGVDGFQKQCFAFAADYAARWSPQQAQAMAMALSPDLPTQDEIASQLGISRQAVGLRLKAAGHRLLAAADLAFRTGYAKAGAND
ncbi:MAG: hypothetical protein QM656_09575 [Paracoccaceae bacterium]